MEETFVKNISKSEFNIFSCISNISMRLDFIGESSDKKEINSILDDLQINQKDIYGDSISEIFKILERQKNKKINSNSNKNGILTPIPKMVCSTKYNKNFIKRVSRPINLLNEI